MFWVWSVVRVSSRVTTFDFSVGWAYTTAGLKTPAQRATVAFVRPKRCGSFTETAAPEPPCAPLRMPVFPSARAARDAETASSRITTETARTRFGRDRRWGCGVAATTEWPILNQGAARVNHQPGELCLPQSAVSRVPQRADGAFRGYSCGFAILR